MTSEHWVGYTFPKSHVTGVRAQWVEPEVSGPTKSEEFVWIGVGGWGQTVQNILQVGTFAYFPGGGQTNQGVWYEFVPRQLSAQFPLVDVTPGDQISASVVELNSSPETWKMSLLDVSSGLTFTKVAHFNSLGAYPSFVVEDPNNGPAGPSGPFYIFPNWGRVTFSNMEVRVRGRWVPAASLFGYRVQMVRNGRTLASAGPINTSSGFTARQR